MLEFAPRNQGFRTSMSAYPIPINIESPGANLEAYVRAVNAISVLSVEEERALAGRLRVLEGEAAEASKAGPRATEAKAKEEVYVSIYLSIYLSICIYIYIYIYIYRERERERERER